LGLEFLLRLGAECRDKVEMPKELSGCHTCHGIRMAMDFRKPYFPAFPNLSRKWVTQYS
jgi:hypothetical protein